MSDKDRPAELEVIEVTPAMVEAGFDAVLVRHADLYDTTDTDRLKDLVAGVYAAMASARLGRSMPFKFVRDFDHQDN